MPPNSLTTFRLSSVPSFRCSKLTKSVARFGGSYPPTLGVTLRVPPKLGVRTPQSRSTLLINFEHFFFPLTDFSSPLFFSTFDHFLCVVGTYPHFVCKYPQHKRSGLFGPKEPKEPKVPWGPLGLFDQRLVVLRGSIGSRALRVKKGPFYACNSGTLGIIKGY